LASPSSGRLVLFVAGFLALRRAGVVVVGIPAQRWADFHRRGVPSPSRRVVVDLLAQRWAGSHRRGVLAFHRADIVVFGVLAQRLPVFVIAGFQTRVGMALALLASPTGLGLASSGLAPKCWRWASSCRPRWAGVGKVGSVDAPSSVAGNK